MAGDSNFQYGMIAARVIALVHTDEAPSDAAWDGHHMLINEVMGGRFADMGYFVITAGGAPNAKQRRSGNQQLNGEKMLRAIVTDSFIVRQLITSWSWFAPGLSSFAPSDMRAALRYVGLKSEELASAWPKVVALNADLATPVVWVSARLPDGS